MRSFRLVLLGTAMLASAVLPALAQPAPGAAPPAAARPGPGSRGAAAMFARIDANNDGRVTWDEAWAYVQARFAEADSDHDGGVTLAEAEAFRPMGPRPEGARPRHAHGPRHAQFEAMMFRMLDADRDGKVTLVELRPAAEARFRGFDANGDNVVTRDELPSPARRGPHRPGAPEAPPPAR